MLVPFLVCVFQKLILRLGPSLVASVRASLRPGFPLRSVGCPPSVSRGSPLALGPLPQSRTPEISARGSPGDIWRAKAGIWPKTFGHGHFCAGNPSEFYQKRSHSRRTSSLNFRGPRNLWSCSLPKRLYVPFPHPCPDALVPITGYSMWGHPGDLCVGTPQRDNSRALQEDTIMLVVLILSLLVLGYVTTLIAVAVRAGQVGRNVWLSEVKEIQWAQGPANHEKDTIGPLDPINVTHPPASDPSCGAPHVIPKSRHNYQQHDGRPPA